MSILSTNRAREELLVGWVVVVTLTTEAMIAEKPDEKGDAGGGMPGMM